MDLNLFLSSGLASVTSHGKGLDKQKVLTVAMAAIIGVNSVSSAFAKPLENTHATPDSPVAAAEVKGEAAKLDLETLTLDNFRELNQNKENAVYKNPFSEGEVLTFLYDTPTEQFIAKHFGQDYLDSEAYAGVKPFLDSADTYNAPTYFRVTFGSDVDPNYIVPLDKGFDIGTEAFANTPFTEDDYRTIAIWHEVGHAAAEYKSEGIYEATAAQTHLTEQASDIIGVSALLKDKMTNEGLDKAQSLEYIDGFIQYRDRTVVRPGDGSLDTSHMTQPSLLALKHLVANDRIDLESMDLQDIQHLGYNLAISVVDVDNAAIMKEVVGADIDVAERHVSNAHYNMILHQLGRDNEYDAHQLIGRLSVDNDHATGLRKILHDHDTKPDFFTEMSDQERAEYLEVLSQMPGGQSYDGHDTMGAGPVADALEELYKKNPEGVTTFFEAVAKAGVSQFEAKGGMDAGYAYQPNLFQTQFGVHQEAEKGASPQADTTGPAVASLDNKVEDTKKHWLGGMADTLGLTNAMAGIKRVMARQDASPDHPDPDLQPPHGKAPEADSAIPGKTSTQTKTADIDATATASDGSPGTSRFRAMLIEEAERIAAETAAAEQRQGPATAQATPSPMASTPHRTKGPSVM
ncbi:hypothetical protein VRRI112168_00190 [Vreelandella rituensis]|uniref:Uncharacterized protein n=1 Tax=Vreelandella rituensis TaxID=2282306 RepID=A0A368UBT0_9GAMM|nr:hypothetical protein [Halomonas rituensis]RCV93882.1 hypothetical protein DU506_01615 [Halomonas rituensis]